MPWTGVHATDERPRVAVPAAPRAFDSRFWSFACSARDAPAVAWFFVLTSLLTAPSAMPSSSSAPNFMRFAALCSSVIPNFSFSLRARRPPRRLDGLSMGTGRALVIRPCCGSWMWSRAARTLAR
eukprot:Amastigsp_a680227_7.p3 type:complete len:125 gc:universal Amastigsp_a680227_7:329-703(+)